MSVKHDLLVLADIVEQGDGFDWGIEKMVAKLTGERGRSIPSFTISLDAVEALHMRLLPHWPTMSLSSIVTGSRPSTYEVLLGRGQGVDAEVHGKASTAPRALLAAVLRAYSSDVSDEQAPPEPA
ncbi:hypothetical protein ACMDCR_18445 [Labrys okinawensis]|uniref:hypothetical protein n=1 Tax=Labrys okinawensis TaxID=346911 RepID=UPI0039BD1103